MNSKAREFSKKSVKIASAAIIIGFDTIECYDRSENPDYVARAIRLKGYDMEVTMNKTDIFPELDIGDIFELMYIKNYEYFNSKTNK